MTRPMFLALALAVGCARAAAADPDLTAFNAFGGKPGLDQVASLGIDKVLQDPRIQQRFAGANIPRLKASLATQFCSLLNGPCAYAGPTMKEVHAGMNLKDSDFNALAEDFQIAMEELGVPFRYQNVLVARLAPMEKDMVPR